MRLATITLATALGLGTVSIPTVGMADWRGDQFGHRHFHNHKTLIFPYGYDDYEYPIDAVGDYPPPSANVVPPPSSPSVYAIAARRHLPSPQKAEALGKSRS